MKYLRHLAAIIILGALVSRAEAKLSPIVINLTAIQQSLVAQTTSTTNITATSTNLTTVQKYTSTNTIINNAKVLKMLANSFNTNIPANAALKLNENGDVVVAVDTNVILNAKTVVKLGGSPSSAVDAGTVSVNQKYTQSATTINTRATLTDSVVDNFSYDDTALTPADGKTTKFTVQGLRTLRLAEAVLQINGIGSGIISYIITLTGAGTGTISQKAALIRGLVVGSVSFKVID